MIRPNNHLELSKQMNDIEGMEEKMALLHCKRNNQNNHEKLTARQRGGVNPYGQPDCEYPFFYDSPKKF